MLLKKNKTAESEKYQKCKIKSDEGKIKTNS